MLEGTVRVSEQVFTLVLSRRSTSTERLFEDTPTDHFDADEPLDHSVAVLRLGRSQAKTAIADDDRSFTLITKWHYRAAFPIDPYKHFELIKAQ